MKTEPSYTFQHTLHWMLQFVHCGATDRSKNKIGLEAIMGNDRNHSLSFQLVEILHRKDIVGFQ